MPISLAETDAAVAEERRLLYVGITRARERLELSYARARNPGGRASRSRTRFLDGTWPESGRGARRGHGAGRGHGAAHGHGGPALREDLDPLLLEALQEWRRQVATETDKPAYTVLVDAALAEIAQTRPATVADLARVRGIGPAKIDRYGASLLAIVSGQPPPGRA
jgi:DNA helicase II / ATP-dependent DNA helicase PcrA